MADPLPGSPGNTPGRGSIGIAQALGAYLWWGLVTGVYFKALAEVSPIELLAWRVLAGLPVMLILLAMPPGYGRIRKALQSRRDVGILLLSTTLIALNWFTFIYAVVSNRLVEASLGYFINPIVTVLLGRFVLGERLRSLQLAAVWLAVIGVIIFGWTDIIGATVASVADAGAPSSALEFLHRLPWIACVLPLSFGAYGLLRKQMNADSTAGLTIEMAILLPFMLGLELMIAWRGESMFATGDTKLDVLLLAGGIVTALPLILFAAAARRLRLATIGQLQYLAPTCQFLLATLVFGEPINTGKLVAFGIIWVAIGLYSWDSIQGWREGGNGADDPPDSGPILEQHPSDVSAPGPKP